MKALDYFLLMVIAVAFIGALNYVRKKKKAGKCIGCSGQCCGHCAEKNDNL